MNAITAIITDDEPLARSTLRQMLARIDGVDVIAEAASGSELIEQLRERTPDLILLDIQMPGTDGFRALETASPASHVAVVFVTAFSEHAIRAFEAGGIDYLLKPYSQERLRTAIDRVLRHRRGVQSRDVLRRASAIASSIERPSATPRLDRLLSLLSLENIEGSDALVFERAGHVVRVHPSEIVWIEAADNYVEIHLAAGTSHMVRETMHALEARLSDQGRFLRAHRSALVNLAFVNEMVAKPSSEADLVLTDGTRVHVSRFRRDAVRDRFLKGM